MLLYNYEHLAGFLAAHPHINNKLACLVRELMDLPHLKVIFSAFAILGVQLVEPFYARTISTDATHSSLKVFYQGLYTSMVKTSIGTTFLQLNEPFFPGVSEDLFKGVKESYGKEVLETVVDIAMEHEEDVVLLVNTMLPERLMGLTDYRLQKLQSLPAASRSIVLKKTRALREASQDSSFRSFKQQVHDKREKEEQWNKATSEKFKDDAQKKQEVALQQERKRLVKLEELKELGGPFTNAEEVEVYLKDLKNDLNLDKPKQIRMKKEVQFARDSSTTLPRVDQLFKIQVTEMKEEKER